MDNFIFLLGALFGCLVLYIVTGAAGHQASMACKEVSGHYCKLKWVAVTQEAPSCAR